MILEFLCNGKTALIYLMILEFLYNGKTALIYLMILEFLCNGIVFLQIRQNHYPEPKATHLTPQQPTYPEGSNGIAVVAPTPNAKAAAAASATAVASANASAKDRQKTKNVAGPPVYYPPGVELFARKEEAMMQVSFLYLM